MVVKGVLMNNKLIKKAKNNGMWAGVSVERTGVKLTR